MEKTLQTLREQHAQLDAVPEGTPLREGLHAVLSLEGLVDEQVLEGTQKKGHLHQVGSNSPILGVQVDEYLIGKKAGDTLDVPQPYPAAHPDTQLAGKTMILRMTVDAVKEQKLPELDDEFAKDCGEYESLEQLKTAITTQLEAFLKQDIEAGYKDQVIERLLQMHHFDIPEVLIDRELQTLVKQKLLKEQRHAHREDDLEEPVRLQEEAKRLQQELHPEAKRRVKLTLIRHCQKRRTAGQCGRGGCRNSKIGHFVKAAGCGDSTDGGSWRSGGSGRIPRTDESGKSLAVCVSKCCDSRISGSS